MTAYHRVVDTSTTSDDMDHLWGVVNAARPKAQQVVVNKEVLTRLLLDHGKLLNYYLGK